MSTEKVSAVSFLLLLLLKGFRAKNTYIKDSLTRRLCVAENLELQVVERGIVGLILENFGVFWL